MSLLIRRRALLSAKGKVLLPKEYQQVEYLQSTGTQYINTKLTNMNGKIEVDFARNDTTSTVYIVGNRKNGVSNTLSTTPTYPMLWQIGQMFLNVDWALDTNRHKTLVTVSTQQMTLDFDGIFKTLGYGVTVNSLNVYLFSRNNDGASQFGGGIKIYGFKYWNVYNELSRDFIPCYRKADNKAGMYDLVNGEFYTNNGTGEFLIGGEV